MKWIAFLSLLVVLLFAASVNAQTCVQADLSHPLQASLSWTDNSNDETGFVLERKLNSGSYAVVAAGVQANITSYIDGTVVRSSVPNTYTYRVKATKTGASDSGYSNEACITFAALPPSPPASPGNLRVASVTRTTIGLKWRDRSNNELGFQALVNGVPRDEFPANAQAGDIVGLQPNTQYRIAMVSLGDDGSSRQSNQVRTKTKSR